MKEKFGSFFRAWWDVGVGLLIALITVIAFYVKSNAKFDDIDKFHEKIEMKVGDHEKRISTIEGKMDTVITLEHEILRRLK